MAGDTFATTGGTDYGRVCRIWVGRKRAQRYSVRVFRREEFSLDFD